MIKITNEVNGKVYKLVPENKFNPCKGCAFDVKKNITCFLRAKDDSFNGCYVCYKLRGIWKEVRDAD
jgi:hypothetical protein